MQVESGWKDTAWHVFRGTMATLSSATQQDLSPENPPCVVGEGGARCYLQPSTSQGRVLGMGALPYLTAWPLPLLAGSLPPLLGPLLLTR